MSDPKLQELRDEIFRLVKSLVDPVLVDLKKSDTKSDEWKKSVLAVVKKIKETARKEYKFDWALVVLDELVSLA